MAEESDYLQNWLALFIQTGLISLSCCKSWPLFWEANWRYRACGWNYAWLRPIVGHDFAKQAQLLLSQIKWLVSSFMGQGIFSLREGEPRCDS
jgi:hypothetical protein